jgi:hypothetical protein
MSNPIDNMSENAVMTTISDNLSSNDNDKPQFNDVYDTDDETFVYNDDAEDSRSGVGKRGKFVPHDDLHFQVKSLSQLYDDSGRRRTFTTQFYATYYAPGTRIRNATTGLYERHRCGSMYESLYYKVTHATGEFGNKDPLTLFYDSPEQYERHWNVRVSQDNKDRWQSKYVSAQRRYLSNE